MKILTSSLVAVTILVSIASAAQAQQHLRASDRAAATHSSEYYALSDDRSSASLNTLVGVQRVPSSDGNGVCGYSLVSACRQ